MPWIVYEPKDGNQMDCTVGTRRFTPGVPQSVPGPVATSLIPRMVDGRLQGGNIHFRACDPPADRELLVLVPPVKPERTLGAVPVAEPFVPKTIERTDAPAPEAKP